MGQLVPDPRSDNGLATQTTSMGQNNPSLNPPQNTGYQSQNERTAFANTDRRYPADDPRSTSLDRTSPGAQLTQREREQAAQYSASNSGLDQWGRPLNNQPNGIVASLGPDPLTNRQINGQANDPRMQDPRMQDPRYQDTRYTNTNPGTSAYPYPAGNGANNPDSPRINPTGYASTPSTQTASRYQDADPRQAGISSANSSYSPTPTAPNYTPPATRSLSDRDETDTMAGLTPNKPKQVAAQPLFNGLLLISFVANIYLIFWLKNLREQFKDMVAAKRITSSAGTAA